MSIGDIIQAVIALGTLAAVVVGIITLLRGQRQAREALVENRSQALETQYAQNRPILMPSTLLSLKNQQLDLNASDYYIEIENVGSGVALDVWGVLLPSNKDVLLSVPRQFSLVAQMPITAGGPNGKIGRNFRAGGTTFSDTDRIENANAKEGYSLCPPTISLAPHGLDRRDVLVGRLVLSYRDVFGRKHASIYDHTDQTRWKAVAHLNNIKYDLEELDKQKSLAISSNTLDKNEQVKK